MDCIAELMATDHRACDDEFVLIEQAVKNGDWATAAAALIIFSGSMARHLGAEETVLFPAFEAATGMTMGPTRMMCMEHEQIRSLLEDLHAAIERADTARFRGEAETLLILMQQHNLKEALPNTSK